MKSPRIYNSLDFMIGKSLLFTFSKLTNSSLNAFQVNRWIFHEIMCLNLKFRALLAKFEELQNKWDLGDGKNNKGSLWTAQEKKLIIDSVEVEGTSRRVLGKKLDALVSRMKKKEATKSRAQP